MQTKSNSTVSINGREVSLNRENLVWPDGQPITGDLRYKKTRLNAVQLYKRDGFPEKLGTEELWSCFAGLCGAYAVQSEIVSGRLPIGYTTLAVAAFEGRDAMEDAKSRLEDTILCLVLAGEELGRRDVHMRRLEEFKQRLAKLP